MEEAGKRGLAFGYLIVEQGSSLGLRRTVTRCLNLFRRAIVGIEEAQGRLRRQGKAGMGIDTKLRHLTLGEHERAFGSLTRRIAFLLPSRAVIHPLTGKHILLDRA